MPGVNEDGRYNSCYLPVYLSHSCQSVNVDYNHRETGKMTNPIQMQASVVAEKIRDYSIPDFHLAYQSGELKVADVTRFFLRRIEELNPSLHAVISVNPDAQKVAEQQDAKMKDGDPLGPLFGIPVLIKDNIETIELPTTAGSLALGNNWTGRDAEVVSLLRSAGAIILGKTNLSEWAYFRSDAASSGWSAVGGQARNPHNTDMSPGGSSSGSGIAVAAMLCVAAIGTETLGSIVSPASANGAVGLKPNIGLVSQQGIVPISHTLDTAGPITRNVIDAAILLQTMATEKQTMDFGKYLDSGALQGKRLGLMPFSTGFDEAVDAVFDAAKTRLIKAGARIIENLNFSIYDGIQKDFLEFSLYEFKHGLNSYLGSLPNNLNSMTLSSLIEFNEMHSEDEMPYFKQETFLKAEAKGPLSEVEYVNALARVGPGAREGCIDKMMQEHGLDALIGPTMGPAWPIDLVNGDPPDGGGVLTGLAALSGYPHVTVPMGKINGLPLGLSFLGHGNADAELLGLAYAFEQVTEYVGMTAIKPGAVASHERPTRPRSHHIYE
jgi:amidase